MRTTKQLDSRATGASASPAGPGGTCERGSAAAAGAHPPAPSHPGDVEELRVALYRLYRAQGALKDDGVEQQAQDLPNLVGLELQHRLQSEHFAVGHQRAQPRAKLGRPAAGKAGWTAPNGSMRSVGEVGTNKAAPRCPSKQSPRHHGEGPLKGDPAQLCSAA